MMESDSIDVTKLPGEEALETPGTKEGENKLVRVGTTAYAYRWSLGEQKWMKIGQVLKGVGDKSSKMLHGKMYDHIFQVDTGEGQYRELGYNNGDNPYTCAQRFLDQNDLNQGFLDQVAEFIIENTKQFVIGSSGPQQGADPLTGGSRYVPHGSQGSYSSSNSSGADPFTGGSRYVPHSSQSSYSSSNTSGADPFTGGSRYVPHSGQGSSTPSSAVPSNQPASSSSSSSSAPSLFPQKAFILFEKADVALIFSNIYDNNTKSQTISESELETLKKIQQVLTETQYYHSSIFPPEWLQALLTLGKREKPDEAFPFFDLLRVSVLLPSAVEMLFKQPELAQQVIDAGFSDKVTNVTQMMTFRFIANLFKYSSGRNLVLQIHDAIFDKISDCSSSSESSVRSALASCLLNISILAREASNSELTLQCVSVLDELLGSETEPAILNRYLAALGTLCYSDRSVIGVLENMGVHTTLSQISVPQVQQNVKQLLNYLQN